MKDGIHIPALAVRTMVLALVAAVGYVIYHETPQAKRYYKIERMSY